MAPVGRQVSRLLRIATASLVVCAALGSQQATGQGPPNTNPGGAAPMPLPPVVAPVAAPTLQVLDIRIDGNRKHSRDSVLGAMTTRIGHAFDQSAFEKDVRKLTSRSWFVHVVPKKEYVPGGMVITLLVVERPVLQYVKYFGMDKVSTRALAKETGLKQGDPFDPYAVREGRGRSSCCTRRKVSTTSTSKCPREPSPATRAPCT